MERAKLWQLPIIWTQMWPEQTFFFTCFMIFPHSTFFFFPLLQKRRVYNQSGMLIFSIRADVSLREFQTAFVTFCVLALQVCTETVIGTCFWHLNEGVRRRLCNLQFMKCNIWHMCSRKVDFLGWNDSGCFLLGCLPPDFKQRRSQNEDIHVLESIFLMFFLNDCLKKNKYNITLLYYS